MSSHFFNSLGGIYVFKHSVSIGFLAGKLQFLVQFGSGGLFLFTISTENTTSRSTHLIISIHGTWQLQTPRPEPAPTVENQLPALSAYPQDSTTATTHERTENPHPHHSRIEVYNWIK